MIALRCPVCNALLDATRMAGAAACPSCGRTTSFAIFPALFGATAARPPVLPADPPAEGEAACYYSPARRATKECSHCGVLISDMWAAQWGGDTVCLKCLEHLRDKGKDARFEGRRVLWDNVALLLALLPPATLVFWWATIFTAPAALFIGLRHWNSPRSLVPRGRARLVLAIVVAAVEIAALVVGAGWLWFGGLKKL